MVSIISWWLVVVCWWSIVNGQGSIIISYSPHRPIAPLPLIPTPLGEWGPVSSPSPHHPITSPP
ncbi:MULTISPECIES: hypothetical protein [Fischerella]|uniref:hypothetical protein n=1 Tax=Fischerella TaxID=1190 RepID=UPI0002F443A5|nr:MULTISPECIES: hypothetical protein [Fischerella]MBD2429883.1 hypothetical protein [Fischerella sp. FACHB-380]